MKSSEKQQYLAEGIFCLKNFLSKEQLQKLKVCYDWGRENPSRNAVEVFANTRDAHYNDNANPNALPMYAGTLPDMPFGQLLADLWGVEGIWFLAEELFAKEGGNVGRSPWHQDTSYIPIEAQDFAGFWISFESIPAENSLEVVPGSHLGVLYDGTKYADPQKPTEPLWGADSGLPPLPDIEAERMVDSEKWPVKSYATQPGDVILFHPSALHGGAPLGAACPERHTLVLRFFGEQAVHRDIPHHIFPKLTAGDPLSDGSYLQIHK
ncbi:MAG: phytanoyl-CoA dioxygenase family protein [Gammaproteobacteria bacterium]|nr:phytanoyl-CoA dioxygenase family protein [Gammaproteobacteria bacterium]